MWKDVARGITGCSVVALFGLLMVTPATAQTPEADVSDKELKTFVEAYVDVQEVRQEMERQLGAVQDPAQAQTIQQQYNQEMTATIEEHGFEPEEYQEIVTKVNTSEELRDRFYTVLEEVMAEEKGEG